MVHVSMAHMKHVQLVVSNEMPRVSSSKGAISDLSSRKPTHHIHVLPLSNMYTQFFDILMLRETAKLKFGAHESI